MNRKLARIAARFFPLLLLAVGAAQATPGAPLGAAFPISTNGDSRPVVAGSAGGGFVAVYYAGAVGSIATLAAQRINADGTLNGAPIPIASGTGGVDLAVAADAAGDFVVVWDSFIDAKTSIMAQRFAADGSAQGAALTVGQGTVDGLSVVTLPAVAMSPDGKFVVTWLQGTSAGVPIPLLCLGGGEVAAGESSIRFRAYDSDGTASSLTSVAALKAGAYATVQAFCAVQVQLSVQNAGTSLTQSVVAMGSGGDFTLAWSLQSANELIVDSTIIGNTPSRITLQHYTALGLPTDGPQVVQSASSQPAALQTMVNPSIAVGTDGIALSWDLVAFDTATSTETLSLNDRGYSSSTLQPLGAAATTASGRPFSNGDYLSQIAATPGGSVVAWRATQHTGSTYPQQINAQLLSAAGAAQGAPIQVVAVADSYTVDWLSSPAIASDGNGNFLVVWEENTDPTSLSTTIFGRLYSAQ
jgi:hypothetical protein